MCVNKTTYCSTEPASTCYTATSQNKLPSDDTMQTVEKVETGSSQCTTTHQMSARRRSLSDDATRREEVEDEQEVDDMASTSSGSAGNSCLLDNRDDDEFTILCELVGARNLSINLEQDVGDTVADTLRPFCAVRFGDQIIHKTKVAEELGPDPIWTTSTRSLFLLRGTPREFHENALIIGIYSKRVNSITARLRRGSPYLFLGQVTLDSHAILSHCDQTRFEVDIEDELGEESSFLGSLALRFRLATESDKKVVQHFNDGKTQQALASLLMQSNQLRGFDRRTTRSQAKLVTETDEGEVAQVSFVNALSSVFSARTLRDKETGHQKVKVKPYPDPEREQETKFMSPQEIRLETRGSSHRWVEAGSGTLGRLYCEVLACHDLPNVDFGEAVGNVTDTFVCLVYEDACAMTDVIYDELSPHWLPWTQRAFSFGFMHPASILYIGVFDYDLGTSHEPIGRIAVNVSNLQRNTIHTLKYSLYPSSNITERTPVGSITIRVRIECPDEKAALLAALKPRPRIFVNVKKPKSFKVVRYTCFGEFHGEEQFDLTVARSYMNEFFEYKAAFSYAIADAARSLIFWRGQVEIFSVKVPLHSFLFFCMATDLVERPHMVVPYLLLSVAWIMLATLTIRRQHPSPWNTSPSFYHYLYILWTGKSPTPVSAIKEHEGEEAAKAYEDAWKARLEADRLMAEKQWKLQEQLNKIGDDNMSTKLSQGGIPLDVLARLTRWQGMAARYCGHLRFIKILVTWEESVVSFWITAVFLVSGIVTMFLPWRFIWTWTGRLFVWVCLGPHMKLIDLYFRANRKEESQLLALVEKFNVQSALLRMRREEALKMKDIKARLFGEYSTQVPSFNLARHLDRPLPESSARLCRSAPKKGRSSRRISVVDLQQTSWIPGQQLFGVMIPRPHEEFIHQEAELAQHEQQLERLRTLIGSCAVKGGKNTRKLPGSIDMHNLDDQNPLSSGYEIIADFDCLDLTSEDAENKRISVVPVVDEKGTGVRPKDKLLVEMDDASTDGDIDDEEEEEGLEVVGLGRFGTFSDENQEGTADEVLQSFSRQRSSKTVIAYYCPDNETLTDAAATALD